MIILLLLVRATGHLTRNPYGYFRCPGNRINAVLMWFVFCGMIWCFVYGCSQINWYWYTTYKLYGCYSSRTSRSLWIAHSTQRQQRSCNNPEPKPEAFWKKYIKSTPIKGLISTAVARFEANGESRTDKRSHGRRRHYPLNFAHLATATSNTNSTLYEIADKDGYSSNQYRRQEVFTRGALHSCGGALRSCGGLCVCAGGLDIEKMIKPPMTYSVSYFDLRGLSSLFGRSKPTKAPRGDETGSNSKIVPAKVFPVSSEISDLRN